MPTASLANAYIITGYIGLFLTIVTLVLLLWAFIHTLTQRAESFAALGGIPKWGWMLICAFGGLLTYFAGGFFMYIALGAAAYYLLETRTGLRDIAEGRW